MKKIKEEITNSVGTGGYTGSAAPSGPVAGFDPILTKMMKRKIKGFKTFIKKNKNGTN
jgi:hypothetical protein